LKKTAEEDMRMTSGYYRYPTIHENTVVFVCEDDLWTVPVNGGIPRRLTSNLGEVTRPFLSPDGKQLAFVGLEEGQPEIYVMPALGGRARRLTYLGGTLCCTAGWTQDGKILFTDNAGHWYLRFTHLYTVDTLGNPPEQLNLGLVRTIAYGPLGEGGQRGCVIGRFTDDPARWKRYRGGSAGQLWIDEHGSGNFRPLFHLPGNLDSPMWIGPEHSSVPEANQQGRVYFISDHEGFGNLYSCLPSGEDIRRLTDHEDYYIRNATSDGRRIVYHAGANLYLFDPAAEREEIIPVEWHSPQTQRNRKFVDAGQYLQGWSLHPKGHSVTVSTRGQVFSFANWEGAVMEHSPEAGKPSTGQSPIEGTPAEAVLTGVRCRLPCWLNDGERIIAVTDAGGEECFAIFHTDGHTNPQLLNDLDIGRPEAVAVNPCKDQIVFSNHRYEINFLDLETRELRRIDRGEARPIAGFNWSPDGQWVAYSISQSLQKMGLKLWKAVNGETTLLTEPVLRDVAPAFDPKGKYLYFLSYRNFDPVYDNLQFDLGFPRGVLPYLITLQKDAPSPFIPQAKPPEAKKDEDEGKKGNGGPAPVLSDPQESTGDTPEDQAGPAETPEESGTQAAAEEEPDLIQIDLEGIADRIVAFPISEGRYERILGTQDGRVLYSRFPIEGALSGPSLSPEIPAIGTLLVYNFEDQKEETLISGISDFALNQDGSTSIYNAGGRLRVLKAGEKPDERAGNAPSRKSGWLDLDRIKVSVSPGAEWRQMFREAWRLQRDQFWAPDMSHVDWVAVHDRYLPLVDRVSSRSEFSDLMWEMQGELGTSHAYEFGGDYRPRPHYSQGFLGASYQYDAKAGAWRITQILHGDPWDARADSPLNGPGINVKPGDQLMAINGKKLDTSYSPAVALVNMAGEEVVLTISEGGNTSVRNVTVKAMRSEMIARYRQWVRTNQERVHAATQGRVGYIHIPDMAAWGYAEFHRAYLAEVDRLGLIVDVRFNRGGHVSQLLLEKLARRRLGYDSARWSQVPIPYPVESVAGPMVALTNEYAGSDGDIFSHGFKLMHLGPLIGKRTWGGVIGFEPRHILVDGTLTTQPEYSFWFNDVGWGIENYGTDPDIEVDITPQDYARQADPQLERAITEIANLLEANPPVMPEFRDRPSRAAPRLPKR
jgi:tricorn protease